MVFLSPGRCPLACIASPNSSSLAEVGIGRAPRLRVFVFCHACHPCYPRSLLVVCRRGRGWALQNDSSSFGPAGTPLEAPVGRHLTPPLYTMTVSAIRTQPSFQRMPCRTSNHRHAPAAVRAFSTVAVRPINVDHAFVNGAAEAGQTQISLSNGLALSGYGSAVPPYGG